MARVGLGSKKQRDQLRAAMQARGYTPEQIATEMVLRWGFRPRQAWRHAYGWTQDEVANRYNQLLDDSSAPISGKLINDLETWPDRGVKPTLVSLRILAAIYNTTLDKLVDLHDRKTLDAHERTLETMGDRFELLVILPVQYYIDTDDEEVATSVELALDTVLDSCGFQPERKCPVEHGSFFRKVFYASKGKLTPEEISASLAKVERAAGVRALDLPQSQVDANRADGVAKLLTSLDGTANAVVQIGSIFLIKVEGTPVVMNLTPQELAELEREPHLFRSPREILNVIQKFRQGPCESDELPAM